MTDELRFDPARVAVQSGRTVTWNNESNAPHRVSAYEEDIPNGASYFTSGGFTSERAVRQNRTAKGFLETDETYVYTFEVPGTY